MEPKIGAPLVLQLFDSRSSTAAPVFKHRLTGNKLWPCQKSCGSPGPSGCGDAQRGALTSSAPGPLAEGQGLCATCRWRS